MREIDPRDCQYGLADTEDEQKQKLNHKSIDQMTPGEVNREIVERSGGKWNETREVICTVSLDLDCAHCDNEDCPAKHPNPDYHSDPVALLRVMMGREDWPEFSKRIGFWAHEGAPVKCFISDTTIYLNPAHSQRPR